MLNRLKDVFKSFELNNVRYLVIGGIAAILYGVPRATFDLDILKIGLDHGVLGLLPLLLIKQLRVFDSSIRRLQR